MNDEKKTVDEQLPEVTEEKKAPKKKKFLSNPKFRHGGVATALTAGFLVIVILLNVVVSLLSDRFPSMDIDITKNSTNSLSEDAIEVVDSVSMDTTIYIMLTEEQARQDLIYGQAATLAEKMAERNSKIQVVYKDLDQDPTFVNQEKYADLQISQGTILVETDRRARALNQNDLYTFDYQTYQQYSKVDGALASALSQVNSDKLPVVAFATGHNEMVDMSAFQSLLSTNNFEPVSFDLMTEEIPEDAQIVVLATPSTDYTLEELSKLDGFLNSDDAEEDRMLLVTSYYGQQDMPNFDTFLEEWGLATTQQVVMDENTQNLVYMDPLAIKANIQENEEMDVTLSEDGYNVLAAFYSSPIEILFDNRATVTTYTLLTSSDTSYAIEFNEETGEQEQLETKSYVIGAAGQKYRSINNKSYHSCVVALGSSQMFSSTFLNSNTYGNSQYLVDLARYGTGTTDSNLGIYVRQVELNAVDINVPNSSVVLLLGIGVFTLLPLVAFLVAGIVVFLKRRHL